MSFPAFPLFLINKSCSIPADGYKFRYICLVYIHLPMITPLQELQNYSIPIYGFT